MIARTMKLMQSILGQLVIRRRVLIAMSLLVAMGIAITYASIPAPNGVLTACFNKSGGSLRVIDASVTTCGANETSVSWNQTGPQGPIGPQGAVGATGAQGPIGTQGPAGPSDIYMSGEINASGFSSSEVVVKSLALPQGSWLLGAKVGVQKSGSTGTGFLQCRISTTTATNDLLHTTVDNVVNEYDHSTSASLAGALEVPSSFGQTVYLICSGALRFDNPKLYAVKTGKLTLQ